MKLAASWEIICLKNVLSFKKTKKKKKVICGQPNAALLMAGWMDVSDKICGA